MQTAKTFKITTEGTSRTTILSLDGTPIARFYARRFDPSLLSLMVVKLNGPDNAAELRAALTSMIDHQRSRYDASDDGQRFFRENNAAALSALGLEA